jgi:hypothetical protein
VVDNLLAVLNRLKVRNHPEWRKEKRETVVAFPLYKLHKPGQS